MLSRETDDTKTKIMLAAFELFGKNGFSGTSVREIAEKSGVNLAAINYHFQNKENLFWEIMKTTYLELEEEIRVFSSQSKNTHELALKVFRHFLKEKYALANAMKMMLSENLSEPKTEEQRIVVNNPMGPPGGQYFAEQIQKDIPYQLSREALLWGIKSVFGAVFHWGVMCFTSCINDRVPDPLMTPEQIEKDVMLMVDASLEYLRNNKSKFSAN